ncbi:DUF6895 family protein [Streptomyces sp. NPDC017248]|uniref:DUF6895 family protein n=1 Tax=unclassified Streptomyces TaxID=2593676 RepID=UPI0037AF6A08
MSTDLAPLAHRVRSRALDWLHTHRRLGALPHGTGLGADLAAYKAVAEVALAAGLTVRSGTAGSREHAQSRELLDFGWSQMRHGDLLYERLLHHPLTTDPLECYSHFAVAGYRHHGLEDLVAHLAATGVASALECVPNRRLAIANALRATGHDRGPSRPDWPALTRATWLGATPQPWLIDWETAYAMTHTVFHLTDWGRNPQALGQEPAAYLGQWLPVWTDVWSETCQWDLVGELLIVGNCLPQPYAEVDDWQRLAQVQHPDGLMPRDADGVDDDPATRFADHQHTTVVAVIAATVALARDLETSADSSPDEATEGRR